MAREQITWHTEPNDSVPPPLRPHPSQLLLITSLSYLLYIYFLWWFFFFFFLLVLAHVRNCPESMRNAKKIFLQFSRRRRKWTTIMRISSESRVWSEFVTSREHDGQGAGLGGVQKEVRKSTTNSVRCSELWLCATKSLFLFPLPSQEPEGHASIE